MKILIVSGVATHPVNAGNSTAIVNQVELFRKMGHEVSYLYVNERPLKGSKNQDFEKMIEFWGARLFIYTVSTLEHMYHLLVQRVRRRFYSCATKVDDFYPLGLNKYIKKLQKRESFDCIIANYYFFSKALNNKDIPLKGLYTHDYFAYKNMLVGDNMVAYSTDAHQEAIAMQRAPHIFALNTDEAIYFQKLSPSSAVYNTFCYYNYYNTNYVGSKRLLLFSGDNKFNIAGINWFLVNVYPQILQKIPDAELVVGGRICSYLRQRDVVNCKLLGYVENALDFYRLGDIVINPTFQGTGLKIKTFEALSYGKIVVAHPHSVAGIYDRDSAPVFSSANPEQWVQFIEETICNREKVMDIKYKDEEYIHRMNEFIENQYITFFKSHT